MAIHVIQSQSIEVLVQGLLQNTVKPSRILLLCSKRNILLFQALQFRNG